jgi:hypothetical protein
MWSGGMFRKERGETLHQYVLIRLYLSELSGEKSQKIRRAREIVDVGYKYVDVLCFCVLRNESDKK